MTEAEILEDFSEPTSQDIKACLAFASDCQQKLFIASPGKLSRNKYPSPDIIFDKVENYPKISVLLTLVQNTS